MRTGATEPGPGPEPEPLVVRQEHDADIAVVRDVVRAAFGEDNVAALLDELRITRCWGCPTSRSRTGRWWAT